MGELLWPPRDSDDIAYSREPIIQWSGREYDAYTPDEQAPADEIFNQFSEGLGQITPATPEWIVINRGNGRINFIPPGWQPYHDSVVSLVRSLFSLDS